MPSDDQAIAIKVKTLSQGQSDTPFYQLPPFDGGDARVPPVTNIQLLSTAQVNGGTAVAITWTKPQDPNVAKLEVWVKKNVFSSDQPYLEASVADAPAQFTVPTDSATVAIAFVRTVMKNGLGTDLTASPSVAFNVSLASPVTVGASQITFGTLNAVNITSCTITASTFTAVSGTVTVNIDGTNFVKVSDSNSTITSQIKNTGMGVTKGSTHTDILFDRFDIVSGPTTTTLSLTALSIGNIQVVGGQQTGPGNTTDTTDVATRFNNLLTALRNHGLIT